MPETMTKEELTNLVKEIAQGDEIKRGMNDAISAAVAEVKTGLKEENNKFISSLKEAQKDPMDEVNAIVSELFKNVMQAKGGKNLDALTNLKKMVTDGKIKQPIDAVGKTVNGMEYLIPTEYCKRGFIPS